GLRDHDGDEDRREEGRVPGGAAGGQQGAKALHHLRALRLGAVTTADDQRTTVGTPWKEERLHRYGGRPGHTGVGERRFDVAGLGGPMVSARLPRPGRG